MAFDWLFLGSVQKKVVETIVVCLTAFLGNMLELDSLQFLHFSVWTPPSSVFGHRLAWEII